MEQPRENQHFLDYWQVIRSRKEIVIAVSLFVIVTGMLVTFSLPKVYMASTRIGVRRDGSDVPLQQQQMLTINYDPYFLRTQFEIIQSRKMLYEVIRNLDLPSQFGRAYHEDGSPLSPQDACKIVSRSMKVQQYRDTNLIEIRIYRSKPKETARQDAARIANEIAAVYRDQRMKMNRAEKERGVEALNEQYGKQHKKVEDAEARLEVIRKELGISVVASQEGFRYTLEKSTLARLEADRIDARNRMLDRKTRLDELNRLQGNELLYSAAALLNDQTLSALRQQLNESEVQLQSLLQHYGAKHPDVIRAQVVVDDVRQKITDTLKGLKLALQTDFEIARKAFDELEGELQEAKKTNIQAEGDKVLPLTRAEGELTRQREIRDALEMRLIQERIELELPRTPVEIIDLAEVPEEDSPVSPNLMLNLIISIIVGMGFGIGLAFFIEYVDTSVKTVEDIERHIGAPILGVIPQKVRPLLDEGPDSPHAEAYRVLRTNIKLSKKLGSGNTLCFTSGGAGEGKSLTLFNLAYVCARLGEKVLVVDSDMRRPTQHKMLNVSNRPGLADLLTRDATVDQVVRETQIPNLYFIASGRVSSASHGLLDTQRMRALVSDLRSRFDLILFDAPPILGVSDASVISSEVDAVLLLIQHRHYPRVVSSRAKAMVENVGGNLIGVVLNNINVTRDYYYYYHSYYYSYNYRPSKEDRARDAAEAAQAALPAPPEAPAPATKKDAF